MGTTATTFFDTGTDAFSATPAGLAPPSGSGRSPVDGDTIVVPFSDGDTGGADTSSAPIIRVETPTGTTEDQPESPATSSMVNFDVSKYRWEGAIRNLPFKRGFDMVASLAALLVLAPLLILIALIVRLSDGGPALFAQTRICAHGRPFKCLKFRTMVTDAEVRLADLLRTDAIAADEWARSRKLTDDPRQTRLGKFLRRSSLDELPQLWNILVGDMSFVGPRPIVPAELERYGLDAIHYLRLRPGLTGPWQIGGRSETSYDERVLADRLYSLRRTFWGDLCIVVMTVPAVLKQHGAR